jgi:hypothetical protein
MSALILFSLVVVGVIALQINNNQRRSSVTPVPLHYINKDTEFIERSQEPVFLKGKVQIKTVHQLRQAILDDGHLLKNVDNTA